MILAQPPEDVFHVDDRVIDHFADRDGEPAERECVETDAEAVQNNDGAE